MESTIDAQRRLYRLKPEPLHEVDAWLAQLRRFWSAHVDALERHLDRIEQSTPTRRNTKKNNEEAQTAKVTKEKKMKIKVTSLYVDDQD